MKQSMKLTGLMMMIAGLSMGNQSCEQANTQSRVLKMEVEIGTLNARPVQLPTGETVDFPYVVNSLFYRQVMNNDHFVISNAVPTPLSVASSSGSAGTLSAKAVSESSLSSEGDLISNEDEKVLERFGFMNKLREQARAAGTQSQSQDGLASKTSDPYAELPACLYDLPQARLGGEVISFEATWGAGIGVGYGQGGSSLPGNAAGRVNFSSSKLEIGLRTDDPLSRNTIAIADGVANQSKVAFGVDFNAGLPIGLDFFFNTPLSDVIRKSMDRGLDKIVEAYLAIPDMENSWDNVWESRVVYDPVIVDYDTHIAFRGGYRAGVQVGDKFEIKNLHYLWEGTPCASRLKYRIPLTTDPIAEVEVVQNGDNVSVARVTKALTEDARILPGAQVKILALKQPQKAKTQAQPTTGQVP